MACFVVPVIEAIVVTTTRKIIEKKENLSDEKIYNKVRVKGIRF